MVFEPSGRDLPELPDVVAGSVRTRRNSPLTLGRGFDAAERAVSANANDALEVSSANGPRVAVLGLSRTSRVHERSKRRKAK
jgi:hypothetical protein